MNGQLVHAIERGIEQLGQAPLDEQAACRGAAHQAAHGIEVRQRDQRAAIAEDEILEGLAVHCRAQVVVQQAGLLMRGLGARRYALVVGLRAGGAVAQSEDAIVVDALQGLMHLELMIALGGKPQFGQKCRRAYAGGPDVEVGGNARLVGGDETVLVGAGHAGVDMDLHAQAFQLLVHGAADALGQRRQDARCCLDEVDLQLAAVHGGEPVAVQHLGGADQFGGQLDAGGTGTDEPHAQVGMGAPLGIAVPQEGVEHVLAEAFGLLRAVDEVAVLGHARGAEVVGDAAQRHHQVIVLQRARRQDHDAVVVDDRRQRDGAVVAVEVAERAALKAVAVRLGMPLVGHFIEAGIEHARGHFMQQGLPDVRGVAVDQNDLGALALAELAPQAGDQFEATCASPDHHDARCRHDGLPKNETWKKGVARVGHRSETPRYEAPGKACRDAGALAPGVGDVCV
uniref:NADH dehydrogenase n=1 Tax=Halopseudomonas xiamenensis TaxID=157792 RepID=Q93P65_9GAMM|nr:NADH dehydrogenase [Halopseudomonas xiamenensis]